MNIINYRNSYYLSSTITSVSRSDHRDNRIGTRRSRQFYQHFTARERRVAHQLVTTIPYARAPHQIVRRILTTSHRNVSSPIVSGSGARWFRLTSINRFEAQLTEREIYVNDEKTRSFIGLNVTGPGCSQVVRLIKAVDSVMKSFAFPVFYEDPKPHVTVAWMLGDVKQQHYYPSVPLEEDQCLTFHVDVVQCRIGKFNHFFKLK